MPNLDSAKAKAKTTLGSGKERISNSRVRHPTKIFQNKSGGPDSLERAQTHRSTPLECLQDPGKFGPPPKTNTAGLLLAGDRPRPPTRSDSTESAPRLPPAPFKRDTTGIDVSHLPVPPTRNAAPVRPPSVPSAGRPVPAVPPRSQPSLPPRLPQRTTTLYTSDTAETPPELPPPPAYTAASPPSRALISDAQLYGVTSRLQRLTPNSTSTAPTPSPPLPSRTNAGPKPASTPEPASAAPTQLGATQGVSRLEKGGISGEPGRSQPVSGINSLRDAKSTAVTIDDFRRRNGDALVSGLDRASTLSQRSGSGERGSLIGGSSEVEATEKQHPVPAAKKAPPPPPPPKRRDLIVPTATGTRMGTGMGIGLGSQPSTPPPVPLASKPRP